MLNGGGEFDVDKIRLIVDNQRLVERAEVAEQADARDSKSRPGNRVRVRLPPSAVSFLSDNPFF